MNEDRSIQYELPNGSWVWVVEDSKPGPLSDWELDHLKNFHQVRRRLGDNNIINAVLEYRTALARLRKIGLAKDVSYGGNLFPVVRLPDGGWQSVPHVL